MVWVLGMGPVVWVLWYGSWVRVLGKALFLAMIGFITCTLIRCDYINKKYIFYSTTKDVLATRTRSSTVSFDFKRNCFLCGNLVTNRAKSDKVANVLCKNREVDTAICDPIAKRNNDWSMDVKGRLETINDLRAEEAVYHKTCNSNFRTGKAIPKSFRTTNIETVPQKRGRQSDMTQEAAFLEIAKYLNENNEGQITLTDLANMMGKMCSDATSVEGYSNIWMKKRLIEHFKDEINIINFNGKQTL